MRQLIVTGLWIIGAIAGWVILWLGAILAYVYIHVHFRWTSTGRYESDWWLVAFFGGIVAASVGAFLLGTRGRLPGTSKRERPITKKL